MYDCVNELAVVMRESDGLLVKWCRIYRIALGRARIYIYISLELAYHQIQVRMQTSILHTIQQSYLFIITANLE